MSQGTCSRCMQANSECRWCELRDGTGGGCFHEDDLDQYGPVCSLSGVLITSAPSCPAEPAACTQQHGQDCASCIADDACGFCYQSVPQSGFCYGNSQSLSFVCTSAVMGSWITDDSSETCPSVINTLPPTPPPTTAESTTAASTTGVVGTPPDVLSSTASDSGDASSPGAAGSGSDSDDPISLDSVPSADGSDRMPCTSANVNGLCVEYCGTKENIKTCSCDGGLSSITCKDGDDLKVSAAATLTRALGVATALAFVIN